MQGGDGDDYWDYPTRMNGTLKADQPLDNSSIQGNLANFYRNDDVANGCIEICTARGLPSCSGVDGHLTDVRSYAQSASHYGTFDQGGNVWEWNEAVVNAVHGPARGVRGGGWERDSATLRAAGRNYGIPSAHVNYFGFRVASVFEPRDVNHDRRHARQHLRQQSEKRQRHPCGR